MINQIENLKKYTSDPASYIIEALYNDIISQEDHKLLSLTFSKKIEQNQLEKFLKDWDIEKFGEKKSMMLSYIMKENPELKFSNYEKPRLEGLLKFHRFRNLKLISHYSKIVKELNKENIFPMILKGGAMKHIRPDLSRAMEDIDILLSEEHEFIRAFEICKNFGYTFKGEASLREHSIDFHLPNSTEGLIDIHRFINLENDYDKTFIKDLFLRAEKQNIFGSEAYLPCFEDLLFLGMINLARNLHYKTSIGGILYSLFDFKYLIENKADFNWDLVLRNIVKTKSYTQFLLAMKFTNKVIPEIFPKSLLQNEVINKKFTKYCNRVMFHRFHFLSLKAQCKNLKIKHALKNKEVMKEYLNKKSKYLLTKIVRKSYFLTKIFLIINSKQQTNA